MFQTTINDNFGDKAVILSHEDRVHVTFHETGDVGSPVLMSYTREGALAFAEAVINAVNDSADNDAEMNW